MKVILTYGTFDVVHQGHVRILERLKAMGDYLIVAVSTDEFNALKGKKSLLPYEDRAYVVNALKCVDLVIPEENWDQKEKDVVKYNVNVFGIGDDWEGKFDHLKNQCEVVYLPRTPNISSTAIRKSVGALDVEHLKQIANAAELISSVIKNLS